MVVTARTPETSERIIEAAVALFAERGYAGVSVRDVAARAGVTKALVFYHHQSKERLFEIILERYYVSYGETLAAAASSEGSAGARLHRLLDANLDFIEENHPLTRIVQVEIALQSAHLPRIQRGMSLLYDAVDRILAHVAPDDGPRSRRHLFVSFSGMINNYFLQAQALEELWGTDPLRVAALRERREHLHWVLEALTRALAPQGPMRTS